MVGMKVKKREIVLKEPFQKFDDRDKLLRLIYDFSDIESVNELASVVFIVVKIYSKKRFSYSPEDFEDFGPSGPMSRKLFEDLFHLEIREKLVSRKSRMALTTEGRERIKRLSDEINFKDVKSLLSKINRDQRTTVATYLYLRDRYSDDKKIKEIIQNCCKINDRTWRILRAFIKRQHR